MSLIIDLFSTGETKTTVSPFIVGGVSDGQWHVVEVNYYNKVWSHLALLLLIMARRGADKIIRQNTDRSKQISVDQNGV